MKNLSLFPIIAIALILNACAGIKFSKTALEEKSNLTLPKDFSGRKFLTGLVAERNNPTLLPGRLIKVEIDTSQPNQFSVQRIPKLFASKGTQPSLELITDGELIKLKVTNKINANANFQQLFDLEVSANTSFELYLSDIMLSIIPDDSIDTDALLDYYKTKIKPSEIDKYYFISNVKVSKYYRNKFVEVDSKATVNSGSVMAVDGKYYNSRDELFQDYMVSASLIQLSEMLPPNTTDIQTAKKMFIDDETYILKLTDK